MKLRNLFFILVGSFFIFSCGSSDTSTAMAPVKSDLTEEAVINSAGCLSAENLYTSFNSLNPSNQAYDILTHINFESYYDIRPSFEKLTAFYELSLDRKPLNQILHLEKATQSDCRTLVINRVTGDKAFEITEATRKKLVAQAEDGESLNYELLSSRRLKLAQRYIALDVPCSSEKDRIFVSTTRVIDWSSESLSDAIDENSSPYAMDRSYLSLIAQATGTNAAEFYKADPNNALNTQIDMARLREVAKMPPLPELGMCTIAPTAASGDGSAVQ